MKLSRKQISAIKLLAPTIPEADMRDALGIKPKDWVEVKMDNPILQTFWQPAPMKPDKVLIREQADKEERDKKHEIEFGYRGDHRRPRTDLGKRQSDSDKAMVMRDFMTRMGMEWDGPR